MSDLATLIYFLAIGISAYLLYHYHPRPWYWHLLAVLGALGIGLVPTPPEWKTAASDLTLGFAIVLLLVWGLGGLLLCRTHREKHA